MGFVRKRPAGDGSTRYQAVYVDRDGKDRSAGTFDLWKQARNAWQEEERKLREGEWVDPDRGSMLFADYVETEWFPRRILQRSTLDGYWSIYRHALKPVFGSKRLDEIWEGMVADWVAAQHRDGVHPNTIRHRLVLLQAILAGRRGVSARRDKRIGHNPCAGIELPTVPKREPEVYTPDEVEQILQALHPWWRPMVAFDSESGLRWGELLGIRVRDIVLATGLVTVRRVIGETASDNTDNGTVFYLKEYPKDDECRQFHVSRDAVTCIAELIAERHLGPDDHLFTMPAGRLEPIATLQRRQHLLRLLALVDGRPTVKELAAACEIPAHIARRDLDDLARAGTVGITARNGWPHRYRYLGPYRHHDEVLRTAEWPHGRPVARGYFRHVWAAAFKATGLPPRRVHDLRASHATWLLAGGATVDDVKDRMGHASVTTTERYLGRLPDADERCLTALDTIKARWRK